jgi:hypothetical protein
MLLTLLEQKFEQKNKKNIKIVCSNNVDNVI